LFEYDDAGRMTAMQLWEDGHRPQLTKFRWNSQNQLTGVLTPGGQQWDYRYDAFGRRTEKVCERAGSRTTYLWDGDVPAEIREYRHNRLYSIRHLVFEGWQLLAQQVQFFTLNPENRHELMAGDIQTQYAVCAPTGEPLALFDAAGHRVWRRPPQSLYGLRLGVLGENAELNPGLQFAGQFLDDESGLVYNRLRYYSPVAGVYLTPDPIGLVGGKNPYSYVSNPTGWIDPLGLTPCSGSSGIKDWAVDEYGTLRGLVKGKNLGLDAHHAGQKAIMKDLVNKYDPNTGPAILVPKAGHTKSRGDLGVVSRSTKHPATGEKFTNARDLIARDIRELRRVYPEIPNKILKDLINMNKKMYPEVRFKCVDKVIK
ncbi:RHS repeat domain-containing protein, partial [Xenorhabdus bovienii]|uniref:RHS repeat domain-containing protein n=1 Tax=Xenorhabdus bovienii TaxID=40576 RepID=UPI0030BA05D6|nr:type IV secretion protein Rhs [Xenorhabdus bovienii]